ncbi:hypothetical protein LY90DRAFT_508930 [Neocallimastix californiae]|uniref:Uncharacterized protein n=1 Tax=Neocallimastix californiae TaxID=1754190 RepID=A0A1Y2CLW6_9FUNG|nr:hypothetical protein LY90DRAFT_508930 [Neocallimastix californiae]|eukprot:ORY47946.1 hypothetical protein LY90DRAFT_508930 [Neocallimastix californiae]
MSSEEEIKKWACDQVSSIIGINPEECRPLIDNIWVYQTEEEIRTEFQNIIGNSISTNMFINEFVSKRNLKSNSNSNLNSLNLGFDGRDSPYEYHKNEEAEEYYSGRYYGERNNDEDSSDNEKEVKLSKRQQKKLNSKKKKGGISLEEWDKEDRTFVTKGKNGRPLCPCQAAKHGLVANCLNCGKIVCKLEGPGPCPFCGEEVIDNEQQVRVYQQKQREKLKEEKTILIKTSNNKDGSGSSSSNAAHGTSSSSSSTPVRPSQEQIDQQRSEKLAIKLEVQMEMEKREKAYEKAVMMRERLLDFDKHSTERTKIYDTATDFDPNMTAANNKWLSPEERLKAIKKEQALREYEKNKKKNVKIVIDLKTKQIIELPSDPFEYKEEESTPSSKTKEQEEEDTGTGYYINPFIKEIPKYVKVNIYDKEKKEKEKPKSISEKKNEQKEKERAAREKARKEAAKQKEKEKEKEENKNGSTSPSTTKKVKNNGKNRIRRIQYDPEEDDMYGVDFAFSDDEDEKEQAGGVCSTDEILKPGIVVDF